MYNSQLSMYDLLTIYCCVFDCVCELPVLHFTCTVYCLLNLLFYLHLFNLASIPERFFGDQN